ncbi:MULTISPECIES: hypothetical protein [unclassified Streptomyces]|uniref:hypothetical protein n=1 Tax=unclassified Streptomyces TaxID=2593676 RepID=UPI003369F3EF
MPGARTWTGCATSGRRPGTGPRIRKGADGAWRIVHLHEDVRQPGGVPEAAG